MEDAKKKAPQHGRSDIDPNGRFNAQDERGGRAWTQNRDEELEYRPETPAPSQGAKKTAKKTE